MGTLGGKLVYQRVKKLAGAVRCGEAGCDEKLAGVSIVIFYQPNDSVIMFI